MLQSFFYSCLVSRLLNYTGLSLSLSHFCLLTLKEHSTDLALHTEHDLTLVDSYKDQITEWCLGSVVVELRMLPS